MLIAFHKPFGVLCQFTPDQPGQQTLADFDFPRGVYPIGRLDLDSEGLILLGDERALVARLLDPKHGHPRTYHAQVEGLPHRAAVDQLTRGGISLRGHLTLPCRARLLTVDPNHPPRNPPIRFRKNIAESWLELVLTEGKNRQVRRMTAAVGHPTLRLIRVAIGELVLEGLSPGDWRELDSRDRKMLG